MRQSIRLAALIAAAGLFSSCSKPPAGDSPLAYVPADTPYVYANLQAVPAATVEQLSRPMQDYWPTLFDLYESILNDAKTIDEPSRKISTALLEEIKTHNTWDKLRQIGLKPDARVAFYGVGLVPVLRMELGDAAAFKAEVARVEQNAGTKLPLARTGDQEYWQPGNDTLAAAIAIQGNHLVITLFPPKSSDALKQALLGVKRPAQSIAEAGTLQALAAQYSYSPYGEGFVDFVRLVDILSKPLAGSDAEFAQTLGLPALASDAACRAEYLEIAHKFPRVVFGAEEMSGQRMRIATQLEIDTRIAQQFASAIGAAPGTGAPSQGAIDFSVALPVLRLKDFWIAQADAVAAKPYACATLHSLNDGFAASKAKVDVTVPPPLSDLTGLRASVSKFEPAQGSSKIPDVAGKLLLATNNPMAALGMAQLALPELQKIKIGADGKPVALPADLLPPGAPPITAAMSDKAIAFATGADDIASLGAWLAAPAATTPVFMRMHFSGVVYGWMARSFEAMKQSMPAEKQSQFQLQTQMFGMYEKWLRSSDFTLTATPTGVRMQQTIELNSP
ncbi:MAG TPA: hypothetical protein VHQ21_00735 [Rhodanobacteraceae bacterium]|nr:hypothetical protein [Rhodanobacteraceae bacterium]